MRNYGIQEYIHTHWSQWLCGCEAFQLYFNLAICDHTMTWNHNLRYWSFVRGIHRLLVNSPQNNAYFDGSMNQILEVLLSLKGGIQAKLFQAKSFSGSTSIHKYTSQEHPYSYAQLIIQNRYLAENRLSVNVASGKENSNKLPAIFGTQCESCRERMIEIWSSRTAVIGPGIKPLHKCVLMISGTPSTNIDELQTQDG